MEKRLRKINLTSYDLLIVQDSWQTHYQILLIIFLKEFKKLNVNADIMIKNCKTCRITYTHCDSFLE